MKKTAKKLFSLFLAALMLLSCFPLAAAAQGGEVITTTQTAGWEDLPAMEPGREFTFTESFRASLVPEKSGLYELYMLNASGGAYDGAKYVAGEDETGSLTKDDVELYYEKSLLELESGKTYNVSCHAIEEDYDAVVKISFVCGHGNKQSKAEVMPSCGLGYTAGVYCPDCKRWLSGHEAVFKSHTDENGDRVCDVCKKESADASGYTGNGKNASYKLYSDGELVISGTGAVGSFHVYDKVKNIHKAYPYNLNDELYTMDNFIKACEYVRTKCRIATLDLIAHEFDTIIFEGGQGLLLDQQNMGDFPHLTPSSVGSYNIHETIENLGAESNDIYYVSRSYMTRHGAGPMEAECSKADINASIVDATNMPNDWQGSLRFGKIDKDSLARRIIGDFSRYKNANMNMVFTQMNYTNGKIATVDGLTDVSEILLPQATLWLSDQKDVINKISI